MSARRSRRAWGWHPLRAEWAERIVGEAGVGAGDLVLDLGAGTGALTAPLAATGARVLAVELHSGRAELLRRRFRDASVTVVQVDLAHLRLPARPFRVVASPPYGLATDLVRQLVACDRLLGADLVLQAAATRRLAERERSRRHRLAVGMSVPRRAFQPPPRVDSAVLRIRSLTRLATKNA